MYYLQKYTLLVLIISLLSYQVQCTLKRVKRIVGGSAAETEENLQHAVSMQILKASNNSEHFCGGTYMGNGWIFTASHCMTINAREKHDIYVEVGSEILYKDPQKLIKVDEIHVLPFDPYTNVNDIAMLRLPEEYRDLPSNVNLPERPMPLSEYTNCSIFGYGSEKFLYDIVGAYRVAPITIQSSDYCTQTLAPYAPDYETGMFCAGDGRTDACQGDSGSGLICNENGVDILVGIVSYGSSCGVPGNPGVYTDVQHHMEWIKRIIEQ